MNPDDHQHNQISSDNQSIENLQNENVRLEREMAAIKEFFGYESTMNLDEMKIYKTECESEDQDESHKNEDQIADAAVELNICAYEISQIYSKLRKCSNDSGPALRKEFIRSFQGFKKTVKPDQINEFFHLISEWLEIQQRICKLEDSL